jgi:hypothetical protein
MPILGKLAIAAALEFCAWGVAGRDLAPRAYVITPLNLNATTLTYLYYTVGLQFAVAATQTDRSAIAAAYLNSLNQTIDLHDERVAALENRIPLSVWFLISQCR